MNVPKKLKIKESMRLYRESSKYFPAGVNSNARVWKGPFSSFMPCALFVRKASGSHIWDVDGNRYIDYRLGYGPIILGHNHPAIRRTLHRSHVDADVYALENPAEIEVAARVRKCVPSLELMRFANSGTEATMAAIRVARAYTKKEKIIKFDGHYHGAHDYVLFSTHHRFGSDVKKYVKTVPASRGVPNAIKNLVIVEDWNDFNAIERTVKKNKDKVAAIITEPIMGNAAGIMPRPGYLKHLKELCDRYGIVLIFDEVKTGFRVGLGGAQEMFGVTPHLSTFAKALGNGFPIALFGGEKEIMKEIGPGKVLHGGTFSANPAAMLAATATLDILMKKQVFKHMNSYGKNMSRSVSAVFRRHNIPHVVNGVPEMFQFLFTKKRHVFNYKDMRYCDKSLYSRLHYELLKRGVMLDEDNEEPIYTSFAHSAKDMKHTIEALEDSIDDALIPRTALSLDLAD